MSTQLERLRETYLYNPDTGHFTRLKPDKGNPVGSRAGSQMPSGYRNIGFERKRYYEHRLAWFYMTGEWPSEFIDHKDLNRANNAWANLRAADNSKNMQNGSRRSDNRSGFKGVCWCPAQERWRVTIAAKHVGYFDDLHEAAKAYDVAAISRFGEFAMTNCVLASPSGPQLEDRP